MNKMIPENNEDAALEALVLKESIVNLSGLSSESLQIGIKGDPSLRETTFNRQKYDSVVDRVFTQLEPNLEELLLNRSAYRIYIGFNNGEIHTSSVFDPLRMEIHSAEKVADKAYLDRHFPKIAYQEKIQVINDIYTAMDEKGIYKRLPHYWKNIMIRRNQKWQAMSEDYVVKILSTLNNLREIQEYYLRNISICTVQDLVRIQFNCDGTQLIKAKNYSAFLNENFS